MSDEKLRELERAFQESGSEEAELAWLRERARAGEKLDWESYSRLHELDVEAAAGYLQWRVETGDLSETRLSSAAHCGHGAAVLQGTEHGRIDWNPNWVSEFLRLDIRNGVVLGLGALGQARELRERSEGVEFVEAAVVIAESALTEDWDGVENGLKALETLPRDHAHPGFPFSSFLLEAVRLFSFGSSPSSPTADELEPLAAGLTRRLGQRELLTQSFADALTPRVLS